MTLASNIQITLCLALALGLAACNEPTSGGSQEPEDEKGLKLIPVFGADRMVEATGRADNALVDLGLNGIGGGAFGGSVSTTGWRNHRGANYVDPGEWEVSLTNQDTGENHSETINIGDGEAHTLSFTFSQ